MRRPSPDQAARRRALAAVAGAALLLVVAVVLVVGRGGGDEEATSEAPPTTPPATTRPTSTAPPPPSTTTPTGRFLPSLGDGGVVGEGPLRTYRVEVEEGTGVDPEVFADEVEMILSSQWGWTAADGISLQRAAEGVDIVVTLATPPTVDMLCYPLQTQGRVSCAQEQRAIINLDRWLLGAEPSGLDVAAYRRYLISHEVGHTLGHSHVECPAPGEPAPVMMQQTHGIGECAPNPWPVPPETVGG